jgi:hypothetical protein
MPPREWGSSPEQKADWAKLRPDMQLTIVKLAPGGEEAARYGGDVIAVDAPDPWVIARAVWTYRLVELDGLSFRPGDVLREWFSPDHPFNAFAVSSPTGFFRGWYANVAYPARLDPQVAPPLLTWHDLYVDLVGLPDGSYTMRDDDELEASGLSTEDAMLYRRIVAARAELVRRFEAGLPPFMAEGAGVGS